MAERRPNYQKEKENIRRETWLTLEKYEVVTTPRPCYGKIPGFIGSSGVQTKLVKLEHFRTSSVIYTTPDVPMRVVREESLRRGKQVILSLPGLKGYVLLDSDKIPPHRLGYASTLRGALAMGERIKWPENMKIDIVFIGSVAVNTNGARLGRGDGLYDLEYGILRELHVISERTPIVTIVHDLQVIEKKIPMLPHDVPADFIITPTRVLITSTPFPRPPGVIWESLSIEFIKSTPILRALFGIS
ncbi:MAG: 5-formyltetrahydrofolate cyclo-ligase [Infirmifilum sp.]|jgi:5-formyltetrahydrofolate cyclo-ligase|uniref:5-formyltetrahydrofolate cyclo-ligase n=1 Tax=Infirmifilum TaxID=2856573 RepID=UPI0023569E80